MSKRLWKLRDHGEYTKGAGKLPAPLDAIASSQASKSNLEIGEWLAASRPAGESLPEAAGKAIDRIEYAIKSGETIYLRGDYDCDGCTSTAILAEHLKALGGTVSAAVAQRSDGYGFRPVHADALIKRGAKLAIILDAGTRDVEAVGKCSDAGVDVICLDHHILGKGDWPGFALVNPQAGGGLDYLCTAGLAYVLAESLSEQFDSDRKPSAELAAIGTLADMSPLVGFNRHIVRKGLEEMGDTRRPGLRKLLTLAGVRNRAPNSIDIAWRVAPSLNAPGRIGDTSTALQCLSELDPDEASHHAKECWRLNSERKAIQGEAYEQAKDSVDPGDSVIVVAAEGWNQGVVGLVAGRLMHEFHRPVFVVGLKDGVGKGSCRAPDGLNVGDLMEKCSDLLIRHGGHAQAGGFSVSAANIEPFRDKLCSLVDSSDIEPPPLVLDAALDPSSVSIPFCQAQEKLGPFGKGNEQPLYGGKNLILDSKSNLGRKGLHTEIGVISLTDMYEKKTRIVCWRKTPEDIRHRIGERVDIAFKVELTHWRGRPEVAIALEDIRESGSNDG